MKTAEDIRWDCFHDSLGQISTLSGVSGILNFGLLIYLEEAPQVVIGIPGDFELYGVKISISQIWLALIVSLLMSLWIWRNLSFIRLCLKVPLLDVTLVSESLKRRHLVFNPFLHEGMISGRLFSMLNSTSAFILHSWPLLYVLAHLNSVIIADGEYLALLAVPIVLAPVVWLATLYVRIWGAISDPRQVLLIIGSKIVGVIAVVWILATTVE